MPVFNRLRDGVLVLTVDGDFTSNELRRIAVQAFEADETPDIVPVLIDMSGAAGVATKSSEELAALGAILDVHGQRIAGLAVVAPAAVHPLFETQGAFGRHMRVPLSVNTTHAEARAWLADRG